MKRQLILALLLCSLCACGENNGTPTETASVKESDAVQTETSETEAVTEQNSSEETQVVGHYTDELQFGTPSGFYDEPFDLEITAPKGCTIYYTTDGSVPDSTKTLYEKPLKMLNRSLTDNIFSAVTGVNPSGDFIPQKSVKKANIVRAAAIDESGNIVGTADGTFFVGVEKYDIPVISIMTDYKNLFDKETGIYIMGNTFEEWKAEQTGHWEGWQAEANYSNRGREWERPVHIELIDGDGALLSQDCGVRIMGAASRSASQKSMRFTAREDYGKKNFKYPLIPDNERSDGTGEVEKYRSFVIRNGGNDNEFARIRDPLLQKLAACGDYETLQGTPVVAYVDGEYWGVYTLAEYYSSHYIENNYSTEDGDVFDDNNIIFIKKGEIEDGEEEDIKYWNDMYEFAVNSDLNVPENFEKLSEMIDLNSFADYIALNIYIYNEDSYWKGNNWGMWRVRQTDDIYEKADGRWRMMVYDIDYSTGIYAGGNNFSENNFKEILNTEPDFEDRSGKPLHFLQQLLTCDKFKAMLANSLCDMRNICFEQTAAVDEVTAMYEVYNNYIPDTYDRFGPEWVLWDGREDHFRNNVSGLANFLYERYKIFPGIMKEALDLGDFHEVKIAYDGSRGSVYLNNKPIPADFTGLYFECCPVVLTAEGAKVSVGGTELSPDETGCYNINITDDINIEVTF